MNKRKVIILIIILIAVVLGFIIFGNLGDLLPRGCTDIAKICPDGSGVGRNPKLNCEFDSCPELIFCDNNSSCPERMSCYKFLDNDRPYCHFSGDPCVPACGTSGCNIIESYPAQVICK